MKLKPRVELQTAENVVNALNCTSPVMKGRNLPDEATNLGLWAWTALKGFLQESIVSSVSSKRKKTVGALSPSVLTRRLPFNHNTSYFTSHNLFCEMDLRFRVNITFSTTNPNNVEWFIVVQREWIISRFREECYWIFLFQLLGWSTHIYTHNRGAYPMFLQIKQELPISMESLCNLVVKMLASCVLPFF